MAGWGGARPKGDQGGSGRRQQNPNQGWFNSAFESGNQRRQDERGYSQPRGQLPRPGPDGMCLVERDQDGQGGTFHYLRHYVQGPGSQHVSTGLHQSRGQAGFYQPAEQAGYGLAGHLGRQLPQHTPHPLDQQPAPRQPTESAGFQRSPFAQYTQHPLDRQYGTGQGSAGPARSGGLPLPSYTPHLLHQQSPPRQPTDSAGFQRSPFVQYTQHPLDRQYGTGHGSAGLAGSSGLPLPSYTPHPFDRQTATGQSGRQLPLFTPHPLDRKTATGQSGRQLPLFTPHPLDRQTATGQSGSQLPLFTPHPLDRQTATGQSARQLPLHTPHPLDRQPTTGHSGRQQKLYTPHPFDKKTVHKPPTEGKAKSSSPDRSRPKSRQKLQPQEKARVPGLDYVPPQRQRSYSVSDEGSQGSQIPRRARARSEPPNYERYVEPKRPVRLKKKYPDYFLERFNQAYEVASPARGGSFEECEPSSNYYRNATIQRPLVRPTDKTGANECLEYLRITTPRIERVIEKFFGTVLSPPRTTEREVTWDHFREVERQDMKRYFENRGRSSFPGKRSQNLYIVKPKQPPFASIYERPEETLYEESDSSSSDSD